MLVRPYLILLRGRLIFVTICSMLVVLTAFCLTSAENLMDIGVFWHHFCGCAPDPKDVRILLYSCTVICFYMGAALGIVTGLSLNAGGAGLAGTGSGPIVAGDTRFLLTRPIRRGAALLHQLAIAATAVTLIPALSYLVLLGWLRLVHAPALGHLAADMALIPSVAMLGPQPSFFRLLAAAHLWRFYLAAISIGLCTYAITAAQRWAVLSPHKWLRLLAIIPLVPFLFSPLLFMLAGSGTGSSVLLWTLLWAPKGATLDFQPSVLAIALHFAFGGAVIYGCWRILQRAEL
jgi:hypothetical protein